MAARVHLLAMVALVLAQALSATASGSIWVIQPDYGPAPPPDKGPPFSFHASRNKDILPYQIVGILGGYVATAVVMGVLLLTVGRRLRTAAQSSSRSRATKMVKQSHHVLGVSPVSPELSVRSWPSPKNVMDNFRGKKEETKVTVASVKPAFDAKVIEDDKLQRQQEMERLYAAVMGQENGTFPPEPEQPRATERVRAISSASFSQPMPPSRSNTMTSATASAPRKDIRAIYPPDHHGPPALPPPPRSPIVNEVASPNGSTFSKTSKKSRKTVRGLHISGPIKYPASNDSEDDIDASTPLSPQFFNAGPHAGSHEQDWDGHESDFVDDYDHTPHGSVSAPRPVPHPAPQRGFSYASDTPTLNNPPEQYANTYYTHYASPSNARNDLPLRALTTNAYLTPASPGLVQTTVIEQRNHYAPYGAPNGMWSATLGPPNTGRVASPRSEYMPYTPITPVTPHLQTKRERKQRGREDLRHAVTAEEDMVPDEKDMWGNGYE